MNLRLKKPGRAIIYLMMTLILALLAGCEQKEQQPTSYGKFDPTLAADTTTTLEYAFKNVSKDYRLQFPHDHGPHPQHHIEWWYITANLEDDDGEHYALQWTQFRIALPEQANSGAVQLRQFYLAHAAIGNSQQHLAAEKYGRGDIGNAGVQRAPFSAFIDHWQASSEQPDSLFPMRIRFAHSDFNADLRLINQGPIMLQGDNGYSRKSADSSNASHYYSMPWLDISGSIQLGEIQAEVKGQAWFDREWTSSVLAPDQQGWDWLALHLDDGSALMLYQLRSATAAPFRFAKWMAKSGETRTFTPQSIGMEPLVYSTIAGRQIPTQWRITLPEMGLDIRVSPLNEAQYMALSQPYWEGAVFIQGSHSGRGFLEMTGY
ncbi:MAG: lipocalin-like domain-containing protein [Amphritea sp.]